MKIDYSRIYRKWHSDAPEHRADMVAYYQRVLKDHLPGTREAKVLDV